MAAVIGKRHRKLVFIGKKTGAIVTVSRNPDFPNRFLIEAETGDSVEKAKLEISNIIRKTRREYPSQARRPLFIDPQWLRDDKQIRLQEILVPGYNKKCYRLAPASGTAKRVPMKRPTESSHIDDLLTIADEVLKEIRQESNKREHTTPLQVDVWMHLGLKLFFDINDGDVESVFSIPTLLAKANDGKRWNWKTYLESGIAELNIDQLHQLFKDHSDTIRTSLRHDISLLTPSGQNRRFKVWIPSESSGDDFKEDMASCDNGSAFVLAGPGFLSTTIISRMVADVAFPGRQFDCRLQIRAGVKDRSSQTEDEKKEDAILIERFCEKVEISGEDLVLPPTTNLPEGYFLQFKRRSERKSYTFRDFELITSRETSVQYTEDEPKDRQKIDLHVHSKACETLLKADGGHSWTPNDVVPLLRDMLTFVESELHFLDFHA